MANKDIFIAIALQIPIWSASSPQGTSRYGPHIDCSDEELLDPLDADVPPDMQEVFLKKYFSSYLSILSIRNRKSNRLDWNFSASVNIIRGKHFIPIISMVNENTSEKTPSSTPLDTRSSEQSFWWIDNLKLTGLEATPADLNPISRINVEEKKKAPQEEIKLEDLEMAKQSEQWTQREISLGESKLVWLGRWKYHVHYRTIFVIAFFVIIVTGTASIILRLYSRYVYFASQAIPDIQYQDYIERYKKGEAFVDQVLNLSDYQQYMGLSIVGSGEAKNIDQVINEPRLSFIQKKDILQQALNTFSTVFMQNTKRLTQLKEDVSKYGFFSKDLYGMLENQEYSTSIKKYLISLEIIKFSSAIKVFGYLETFVSSIANALNMDPAAVETEMHALADRGEKDILLYLNNCYLNPYEVDYDCNLVGDFDRYYAVIDKEEKPIDTKFFKKMMYYVDTKLEQTDLPSFSITFKKYDPMQKQISFTLDVNTFKQDELALIKKGIINPHIFILSNLLNLIKQSVFVISENIDAKSIKITPKNIKIGTSVFQVNNSTMTFTLPIQKGAEREISDYVSTNFTSSP